MKCYKCGKEFSRRISESLSRFRYRKFCTPACYLATKSENISERWRLYKERLGNGLVKHRNRVFHGELKRVERKCIVCNHSFLAKLNEIKRDCALFCSRQCRYESMNTGTTRKCLVCGNDFYVLKSRDTRTCSKKCNGIISRKGEDRKCFTCHKMFYVKSARIMDNRGLYCSKRCIKNLQDTAIEFVIKRFLDDIGLPYKSQFRLHNFTCDFVYPELRLIIEADGKYWHSTPSGIKRDKNKGRYCKRHGWILLRFPEDMILKTPEICLQQIKEKLGIYLYIKPIDRKAGDLESGLVSSQIQPTVTFH